MKLEKINIEKNKVIIVKEVIPTLLYITKEKSYHRIILNINYNSCFYSITFPDLKNATSLNWVFCSDSPNLSLSEQKQILDAGDSLLKIYLTEFNSPAIAFLFSCIGVKNDD